MYCLQSKVPDPTRSLTETGFRPICTEMIQNKVFQSDLNVLKTPDPTNSCFKEKFTKTDGIIGVKWRASGSYDRDSYIFVSWNLLTKKTDDVCPIWRYSFRKFTTLRCLLYNYIYIIKVYYYVISVLKIYFKC